MYKEYEVRNQSWSEILDRGSDESETRSGRIRFGELKDDRNLCILENSHVGNYDEERREKGERTYSHSRQVQETGKMPRRKAQEELRQFFPKKWQEGQEMFHSQIDSTNQQTPHRRLIQEEGRM